MARGALRDKEERKMKRWVWSVLLTAVMMTLLAGTAMAEVVPEGGILYDTTAGTVLGPESKANITTAKIEATVKGVTITQIAANAFESCKKLTTVDISDKITRINESAFKGCSSLRNLHFGTAVQTIGKNAFDGCSQLRSVAIPEDVSTIEEATFSYCINLEQIYLPAAVSGIGPNAFYNCGKLDYLHYGGTAPAVPNGVDTREVHYVVPHDEDTLDPTCTAEGKHLTTISCEHEKCKKTIFSEERSISKLPHTEEAIAAVPPSCSEYGWTEGKRCTVCQTVTVQPARLDKTPHTEAPLTDVPATCTTTGARGGKECSVCHEILEQPETVDLIPHAVDPTNPVLDPTGKVTKEATCEEDGVRTYYDTCHMCNKPVVERTEVIPAKKHSYNEGKTISYEIVKVSCARVGVTVTYEICDTCEKRKPCPDCETIEKKMKDLKVALSEADLTHLKTHDAKMTEAPKHTRPADLKRDEDKSSEPTCMVAGKDVYPEYTCTVCKQLIKDEDLLTEDVPALGHDFKVTDVRYEATSCEAPGKKIETYTCQRENCDGKPGDDKKIDYGTNGEGKTFYETEEPVKATGHQWGEYKITSTVTPATCAPGKAIGEATCEVCHKTETNIEIVLEPVAAHDFGEWGNNAKGEWVRTCKVCGYEQPGTRPSEPSKPDDSGKPGGSDKPGSSDKPGTSTPNPPADSNYSITISASSYGSVSASVYTAERGDRVTLTVRPDNGYELDWIRASTSGGSVVNLEGIGGGQYRFTMPGSNVEIRSSFTRVYTPSWSTNTSTSTGATSRWTEPSQTAVQGVPRAGVSGQLFTDIPVTHWAAGEINWAYNMGYMSGNRGRFNPDGTITFQQMWMVLARISGSHPASMADARNWAVLNGFAEGGNPTHTVARHQMVTALYRCAHIMGSTNHYTVSLAGYPDSRTVPTVARDPMAWAVANGIIGGNANGRLDPFGTITRGQFAVILYRFSQRV